MVRPDVAPRGLEIAGLGDHLEVLLGLEHHPQAVADDLVIVSEDDADRVHELTLMRRQVKIRAMRDGLRP